MIYLFSENNRTCFWLILSLCFLFEVQAPGQCLKFHDRLVSARHRGWGPAKWSPLSLHIRPEWRSIKRVGQAPWPHTSSPLSPVKQEGNHHHFYLIDSLDLVIGIRAAVVKSRFAKAHITICGGGNGIILMSHRSLEAFFEGLPSDRIAPLHIPT